LRRRTVAERCRLMAKAAQLTESDAERHARLMSLEMGKPIQQSRSEVRVFVAILRYYANNGEAFLEPERLPGVEGAMLLKQPLGVVLAIEPWNWPYYQVARVIGPQLVAGNVVVLKHAETVPQCALAIEAVLRDAGFPEGAYTNLFVSLQQVDNAIEDDRVSAVTLTGSERAGSTVGALAGKNLKKVVLELGGSDPFIVLESAPLSFAAARGAFGRMVNAGQSCVASKRFIVVGKNRATEFTNALAAEMNAFRAGDPMDEQVNLGPLFSERGLNTLLKQLDAAITHGATLVTGGKRMNRPGFYLEPTVLTDISRRNPVFGDELFGPVASVYAVETEDEAVDLANSTRFGLGASVFGVDEAHCREIAERIESGMVMINQTNVSIPETPFGGVKRSGFGRELSRLGIGEFLNYKLVRSFPSP
jgi:succinate-semialdehyde dehydrogenase / glutarate-semialdehyde dehydrogenase